MARKLRIFASGLLGVVTVAALACLPSQLRHASLRTLILAAALIAVVFGLLVWMIR
jgi:hypothetical protein